MDTSQYLPMFLAECREHLQELNLAVVRIEEQPDDHATVDEIFRIAHSLKGMSATMGFEGMAALTHQMEDVFELLRQRSGGLSRETVDVLLECLDALSAATDAIDDRRRRAPGARPADRAPEGPRPRPHPRPGRRPPRRRGRPVELPDTVADALVAGQAMLHARVTLAEDTLMPAVRAYMVIAAAADLGRVVTSAPEVDHVEAFDGRLVDLWVTAEVEAATLSAALLSVPDVAAAEVAEAVTRRRARRRRPTSVAGPVAVTERPGCLARRRDRARRRRAPGPAHAPHGRARRAAHAGRGPRRTGRRARVSRRPCRTSRAARTPFRPSSCRCA